MLKCRLVARSSQLNCLENRLSGGNNKGRAKTHFNPTSTFRYRWMSEPATQQEVTSASVKNLKTRIEP